MNCHLKRFFCDESGLATLEWVSLAAAIICLGVGVVVILKPNVNSATNTVGSNIVNAVNSNS